MFESHRRRQLHSPVAKRRCIHGGRMEPEQNMAGGFQDTGARAGADFRTAVLPLYPCIERLINNIGWQYGCLHHAVKAGLKKQDPPHLSTMWPSAGHLKRWCKGSTAVLQTAGTGSNPVRFSTRIAVGPGLFILLCAPGLRIGCQYCAVV